MSGIGCDAKVALDIHNLREENPEKFYNQVLCFPGIFIPSLTILNSLDSCCIRHGDSSLINVVKEIYDIVTSLFVQFMNMLYAREGAKSIMDQT